MNWFRKRRQDPLAGYSDPDRRDSAVLRVLVSGGADLTKPREVTHFLYFPEHAAGAACANAVAEHGWDIEVRDTSPERPEFLVLAERDAHILTPEAVRDARQAFEAAAARFGGVYDGWEASI